MVERVPPTDLIAELRELADPGRTGYIYADEVSVLLRAAAALADAEGRAQTLEAALLYITTEYDCECETPGTSNDCPSCYAAAAVSTGSPDDAELVKQMLAHTKPVSPAGKEKEAKDG